MKLSDFNFRPDERMLRQFGVIALFGFGLLGAAVGWKTGCWTVSWVLWGLGAISFLFAFVRPGLLKPLYLALMVAALPIGFVVGNLILMVVYFGLFTPMALVFRLVGRDAMRRKFDPEAESYWIERTEEPPAAQRFKQY